MPVAARNDLRATEALGRRAVTYRQLTPSTDLVLPSCFFGVEMELEPVGQATSGLRSRIASAYNGTLLRIADDGSLRNGVELTFAEPLLGTDAVNAIDEMYNIRNNWNLGGSIRTSTHVHVNYTDVDDTVRVIQRTGLVYLLIEKALAMAAGEHREWNTFCQPTYFVTPSQEIQFYNMVASATPSDMIDRISQVSRDTRYLGMNLGALFKYGTIEYRMLGTVDRSQLFLWINTLLDIKRVALDESITDEQLLSHETLEGFVRSIMPRSEPCLVVEENSEIQYEAARSRLRRLVGLDRPQGITGLSNPTPTSLSTLFRSPDSPTITSDEETVPEPEEYEHPAEPDEYSPVEADAATGNRLATSHVTNALRYSSAAMTQRRMLQDYVMIANDFDIISRISAYRELLAVDRNDGLREVYQLWIDGLTSEAHARGIDLPPQW
jgi:hypothetical protein